MPSLLMNFSKKVRTLTFVATRGLACFMAMATTQAVQAVDLAQIPLFLSQPVVPIVMLNMSNDHQLYFKAYDDYSDLDGDGFIETTYTHTNSYYGYFDSNKCYEYNSGVFEPRNMVDASGYCNAAGVSNQWQGNFLNWATMTRVDAVRKILYGGMRSTDSTTETILERSFLPQDAHAFAKHYAGSDVARLTPFTTVTTGNPTSTGNGLTICNSTEPASRNQKSQTVTDAPRMSVVKGNYSLWASNERWQCRWGHGTNDNNSALSGIFAHTSSPTKSSTNGVDRDLTVRVKVCDAAFPEENCRAYASGALKPAGLLQEYGEEGRIHFGLLTGSYGKNKSGGVLRKNVGSMADEINVATGQFLAAPSGGSIVATLNAMRIYGYDFNGGTYHESGTNDDNCSWGLSGFTNGRCSNWGNPQAEIYAESLSYLAGGSANFATNDSTRLTGLTTATWADPLSADNYCAPLSIIQFNASTISYDGDEGTTLIPTATANSWTNAIGVAEGLVGETAFVGNSGAVNNSLCTAKVLGNLSDVRGTCPDSPRLDGSYLMAGLAYFARTNDLRAGNSAGNQGTQKVFTYGVALAPAVPQVRLTVPGGNNVVSILPACRNSSIPNGGGNCALVDFKVVAQVETATTKSGRLYVNWEDSEQGGDFDQDMWGIIDYQLTASTLTVTTDVIADSTPNKMGFGYVISGTESDGFKVRSGIDNFTFSYLEGGVSTGCTNCTTANPAVTSTYIVGTSSGVNIPPPLYYASKWGGFKDNPDGSPRTTPVINAEPETYFYAQNPAELAEDLGEVLSSVAAGVGAASSVATSSTRLGTDTTLFQAKFSSLDWSGTLSALALNADGEVTGTRWVSEVDAPLPAPASRNIFTYTGSNGVQFNWGNLTTAQQAILNDADSRGAERVDWVRGTSVIGMRDRPARILGDIVNSNPVFAGKRDYRFDRLSAALGGTSYAAFVTAKQSRADVLYVSANDGMLHAFRASDGRELFSYIPSKVYPQLLKMSQPNYGSASNPHEYSVNGQVVVGDVYVGGSWKTILVGAYGAGARGIFALDVSNPESFSASDVLFEFDETDDPLIGNILGELTIAPVNDRWTVIFGNGYNGAGERAALFVVDLADPTNSLYTKSIVVDNSGSNGLAPPALLASGNGNILYAYAGDLQGRVWKFSLSGPASSWAMDYRLFSAVDGNGQVQAITASPVLGLKSISTGQAGVMVYVGTGRYLLSSDNAVGTTVNSMYALADYGATIPDRSSLFAKTIATETATSRSISGDDNSWYTSTPVKSGWYLDLQTPSVAAVSGERIFSKAQLVYDRLIFSTFISAQEACGFGGSGWLMEVAGVGDRYVDHSVFVDGGMKLDSAVMSLSPILTLGDKAWTNLNKITGELETLEGSLPSDSVGRMSWRQLQ
ncbi:PilC/PilY family type IV pilus protein [Simiduia curdlanivorans]|uniref:Pilus assembly protein n=1 Tax=Simiduia curdlanivorans TaxID=1492769 RepID=A0ABV8V8B7_9GAMM|nr:PilC/PilY family type IV pilus protein [Simiduia curdlanivorans]MDN3639512.1 PilC/PilY family type IV pilus protein [Simiduia curdlanivorans]